MEQQTSFIPKKSLAKDAVVREERVSPFMIIATVVFFVSLAGGVGVYAYKILLSNDIKMMSSALEQAQKAFEPATIVELERLDKRIESAKEILANHIVVSPVFLLISNSTIPNIRFNKFNYGYFGNGRAEVNMGGQSRSYSYVASQSDVLGESKYIKEHIFSNLNLDNSGNVTFDLFASFNPSLILYKEALERDAGSIQ